MEIVNAKDFVEGKKNDEVKEHLENGGLVIFPSESSYGIAGNALNEETVKKVHKIKKKSENKPVGIIIDDVKKIERIVKIDSNGRRLLSAFKKPLTIIFELEKEIPCALNGLGVRVPLNEDARKLCSLVDFPLTATSANISGEESIYDRKKIVEKFGEEKIIFIDKGVLEKKLPSTYYDFEKKIILRAGDISLEEIEKELNKKN